MPKSNAPIVFQLLPLVFFIGVFYFLLIMPQKKQQKKHKMMIEGIKKNDEVVTIGGVHGIVVGIKEKTFILRIADNIKIEVDKVSLAYKTKQGNDKAI